MTAAKTAVKNPYLDHYRSQLEHQRTCGHMFGEKPSEVCMGCVRRRKDGPWATKKRYSWAVPDQAAIEAIADNSPHGVVEIGAGGGYWAWMLRQHGVDVVAYDPAPVNSKWFEGSPWSEVLYGDHTAVIGHPDRALLSVWPCYDAPWAAEALTLFEGDTVVYVGEGSGGCTGDDRFHALLGQEVYCSHFGDEVCDCPRGVALFRQTQRVDIPQWSGIHDDLSVYKRVVS
jgi:hypothetical protein